MHNVLVVEDDLPLRTLLRAIFERQGLCFDEAEDGSQAASLLRRRSYCAVILDLMLPVMNGFELLRFIRSERPDVLRRVIVLTAANEATLRHFDREGIWDLLRKPFDIQKLQKLVLACAEQDDHSH